MTPERKSHRLNARVPATLVARMDFVIRNIDNISESRSAALLAALEVWLSIEEDRLRTLGILPKKAR